MHGLNNCVSFYFVFSIAFSSLYLSFSYFYFPFIFLYYQDKPVKRDMGRAGFDFANNSSAIKSSGSRCVCVCLFVSVYARVYVCNHFAKILNPNARMTLILRLFYICLFLQGLECEKMRANQRTLDPNLGSSISRVLARYLFEYRSIASNQFCTGYDLS